MDSQKVITDTWWTVIVLYTLQWWYMIWVLNIVPRLREWITPLCSKVAPCKTSRPCFVVWGYFRLLPCSRESSPKSFLCPMYWLHWTESYLYTSARSGDTSQGQNFGENSQRRKCKVQVLEECITSIASLVLWSFKVERMHSLLWQHTFMTHVSLCTNQSYHTKELSQKNLQLSVLYFNLSFIVIWHFGPKNTR